MIYTADTCQIILLLSESSNGSQYLKGHRSYYGLHGMDYKLKFMELVRNKNATIWPGMVAQAYRESQLLWRQRSGRLCFEVSLGKRLVRPPSQSII
jgi:hypothetical protein